MPLVTLSPFWQTPDGDTVRLYLGGVLGVLRRLPERSVQCCVTSPPYWGLRSYLDANHQHKAAEIGAEPSPDCDTQGQAQCGRCFVCSMLAVFRGVRQVLREDGVLWLNLGDTYASGGGHTSQGVTSQRKGRANVDAQNAVGKANTSGLPSGNLVGIPWRVALAMQADGWVLRSDVPWVKRSAMPESADNRPAKSLEYVFMFTNGSDYYFDMNAVRKSSVTNRYEAGMSATPGYSGNPRAGPSGMGQRQVGDSGSGRNFRNADLWFESVDGSHGLVGAGDELVGLDVTGSGYPGSHFAVFPEKLITPLILAGTSAFGACAACGSPYERVVVKSGAERLLTGGVDAPPGQAPHANARDRSLPRNRNGITGSLDGVHAKASTVGWRKTCGCPTEGVRPCVVLDPFVGSGTTAAVSVKHGRWCWGIDLSEAYLRENAVPRIQDALKGERVADGGVRVVVRQEPLGAERVD